MGEGQVVVASNRGPMSFSMSDSGRLSARRGGGGLVSGLAAVADEEDVLWVCAALTDADRMAARHAADGRIDKAGHDTGGAAVRMLNIPPATFHRAYNAVANSTLWFCHHMLFDTPNKPVFDASARREWASYREYNATFADAIARDAVDRARTLVQDYHLTLAPLMLRERRPDLRIAHFSHTPWAPPDYFRLLPDDMAREVLRGILGADHVGFLTRRWAEAFMDCCAAVLDAGIDRRNGAIAYAGRVTRVGVHPLGVDGGALRERAAAPDVAAREQALRERVGDRSLIVRVDRTELSKNIVRGLAAYRELLVTYPEWRGRVVHVAFAYPSRHDLPEYREYTAAVQRMAGQITDEFATADWEPLILQVNDDYPRSLAAYRLADVLLVNPIRDGMNLVAKEGPVLSARDAALVLSREAGAVAELGGDALTVDPYDVTGTARALHDALGMDHAERAARRVRLAEAATAVPPRKWFADQLAALG
ncbi:MAG TPA: trehalose-6-phosphate synthase [Streptosporangiaceae bacterium]|jgi:trehalose 6-phosphate synthase